VHQDHVPGKPRYFFVSGEIWKRKSKEITQNGEEDENSELM